MINIAISDELYEIVIQNKNRRHTMDEHLRLIISTHNSIVTSFNVVKEEFDFLQDAYNKASSINGKHWQTIENLERENEVLELEKDDLKLENVDLKCQLKVEVENDGNKVEPARGVAAAADILKNLFDMEQEEIMNQSTEQIIQEEQEVIQ